MAAESVPADGPREENTPRPEDGARPGGSGFASGEVFDTCLPGPVLAEAADRAAGAARDFAGLNDDELIGAVRAFDKMEAWARGPQQRDQPGQPHRTGRSSREDQPDHSAQAAADADAAGGRTASRS